MLSNILGIKARLMNRMLALEEIQNLKNLMSKS